MAWKGEVGNFDPPIAWRGLESAGTHHPVVCHGDVADPWRLKSNGFVKLRRCLKNSFRLRRETTEALIERATALNRNEPHVAVASSGG
jgi:hypothetical protein